MSTGDASMSGRLGVDFIELIGAKVTEDNTVSHFTVTHVHRNIGEWRVI